MLPRSLELKPLHERRITMTGYELLELLKPFRESYLAIEPEFWKEEEMKLFLETISSTFIVYEHLELKNVLDNFKIFCRDRPVFRESCQLHYLLIDWRDIPWEPVKNWKLPSNLQALNAPIEIIEHSLYAIKDRDMVYEAISALNVQFKNISVFPCEISSPLLKFSGF